LADDVVVAVVLVSFELGFLVDVAMTPCLAGRPSNRDGEFIRGTAGKKFWFISLQGQPLLRTSAVAECMVLSSIEIRVQSMWHQQ
jgi:hypothetical protein